MAKDHDQPIGSPPAYPAQVHYDAGPIHPASPAPHPASPYNAYGGFNNPSYSSPSQAHLDPRDANKYGSPAPGNYGYASPAPGGYGPPGGYYGQQQMYYGQQGPYQQGPGYYQQGPPPPQQQYYGGHHGGGHYSERSGGASQGICAGLMGALAFCCCLDFLF